MQPMKPREPGVMLWAGRDDMADVRSLGVRCGQLGLPGDMNLTAAAAAAWRSALRRAEFTLVTVFAAYTGENYADIPSVRRTVGFIPSRTRAAREKRTLEVSDFAARLGAPGIACHIGFVPPDRGDPGYQAVRDVVQRVCDHAAGHSQTFALETGQEPAGVLLQFIQDVSRPNLRVNFDPANLVLYGTGDPIEALRELAPYVASVHAKDGDWPPRDVPGSLGKERPLGQGSVGIERWVRTLAEIGFTGPLNVEREAFDSDERRRDIRDGIELLRKLVG